MVAKLATSESIAAWEAAYLRFETPEQEVQKFMWRLRRLGAARWPRDAAILELFCGRGNGLVALNRLGFTRVRGVDLSLRLLSLHERRGRCAAGDCRQMPVNSNSHDIAVVHGGLHHLPLLPGDLESTVAEVRRILKRGGARARDVRAVAFSTGANQACGDGCL